ncbi:hypothetical protein [Aeromonas phage Akh-2]|nr:hypothetical protein [Aeromonas phage Akh-2]
MFSQKKNLCSSGDKAVRRNLGGGSCYRVTPSSVMTPMVAQRPEAHIL